jgi:hypothetical protein
MRFRLTVHAFLLTTLTFLPETRAAEYYASPDGNGDGSSANSPSSVSAAVNNAQPGDTVYFLSGTYSGWNAAARPVRSGTASAWITFAAAPGALPIFDGAGVGGGTYEYIRYVGLVSRGSSSGFGNGWTDGDCSTMSNGNLEYIHCIADGNDINGIAHYCASGVRIRQCIVAHNGNADPSWSSGVNLFAVQGAPSSNVVEQTISFENIDISSHHSDGSGFILDQNSTGATFLNNIGFRNGGSCIRLTNSPNAQIINNTCVHNGQDPTAQYHDEIFFSDTSTTHQGALLRNNLCIPTSGQSGLALGNGVPAENNIFDGTDSTIAAATGNLDFHLVSGSAAIDAAASGSPTPTDAIEFDWRCIRQQSGQAVSWWAYAVDYDHIASIGGVAACFQDVDRTGTPDVGAYEYGTTPAGTGGSGATRCVAPSSACGDACVDLSSDVGNCGSCGAACGAGQTCMNGSCEASSPCQSPLTQCGGACVDLDTDPQNCGGCATLCVGADVCSQGTCTASCSEGLSQCGQACVDLSSDLLHCGDCDQVCQPGQTCETGVCTGDGTGGDLTVPADVPADSEDDGACTCSTGPPHRSPLAALLSVWMAVSLGCFRRRRLGRSGPG